MKTVAIISFIISAVFGACAQQSPESLASCSFADKKQIAVRYLQPESNRKEIFGKEVPFDHAWKPGGKPIVLFTEASVSLNGTSLPAGAYQLLPTPGEHQWELTIERPSGTAANSTNEKVGTVRLDSGTLGNPLHKFTIYFGRIGDRQCNMRMYWGHTGVWAEFKEQ